MTHLTTAHRNKWYRITLILTSVLLFLVNNTAHSETIISKLSDSIRKDTSIKAEPSFLYTVFSNRPLYTSVGHTRINDNSVDISEVNIGFDGQTLSKEGMGIDYLWTKSTLRMQYLTLGLSYKRYNNIEKQNIIGFNALLFKVQSLATQKSSMRGLVIGGGLTVLEKKSPFYANTSIDWVSADFDIGYDPLYSSGDTRIAIIPHLGLGFSTMSADTNILTGMPKDEKEKIQNSVGNASARFVFSHKSLSVHASATAYGFISLNFTQYSTGISYTFWSKNEGYFQNNFDIFLNYEMNKFSIEKDKKEIYSKSINYIRAGLSFRLMRVLEKKRL